LKIEQHYLWNNIQPSNGILNFQVLGIGSYGADTAVARAMRAASGARFEHGENPGGAKR
jgi:hypothetical protein